MFDFINAVGRSTPKPPSADMLIETVTGHRVNVMQPSADDISLEDIAWSLSRLPRFAGHTITDIPYNVAQHSVGVARLAEQLLSSPGDFAMDENVRLAAERLARQNRKPVLMKALMHDAHEAYTGDIPSPVKKIPELREIFSTIENRLDAVIFSKLELDKVTDDERLVIKYCDRLAQAMEGYQFMPSRGLHWNLPRLSVKLLQRFPAPETALKSYDAFMAHMQYLHSYK